MNAKMNFGKKNGVFFEELFLSKLQEHMKVQSSDGTQFKYCCDIVADDCLLEIKSHRDWKQTQTTQQVLTSIVQNSIDKYHINGVSSGLIYQLIALLDQVSRNNKKTMVIVGVYSVEVNQLYQLFLKDGDRAFAQYNFYDILLMDQDWSGLCRISSKEFWSFIRGSSGTKKPGEELRHLFNFFRFHIGDQNTFRKLLNYTNYPDDVGAMHEIIKHCTIRQVNEQDQTLELDYNDLPWGLNNVTTWDQGITEKKQLEINIEKQQLEINLDKPTQTWIEKEKQAQAQAQAQAEPVEAVAEPVEAVAEPVEAVAERTDGYTYPIIEQTGSKIYDVLLPEGLKRIEDGVRNQVRLSDLSIEFGKSPTYLHATLTNYDSYKDEIWVNYKKWLINLMSEVGYIDQPKTTITSLERAQSQVSKYKREMTKLIDQLAKQEEKYEAKIKKLDDHINNLETNQVDETTTLKLEAYQAEIKKLQVELKECTQYNNEFTEIKKSDSIKIESLQNLCSKQLRELTQLKTEIKNIKLEQQETVVSNEVQEDLNRYKRIIDLLLDK